MSNKFDFGKVRERAVAKANQELEQGLEQMAEQGGGPNPSLNGGESMQAEAALKRTPTEGTAGAPAPAGNAAAPAPAEPTKGVQTYIPMSQYRRLNDIKLTRRENIADLAAQAINLWLDVQEGKKIVVTKPE